MNKKLIIVCMCCIMLAVQGLYASFSKDDVGTAVSQLLKIGVGARAVGMGEAYGAIADDANALYWNPAGIGQLTEKHFDFTYNMWLQNMSLNYISFAMPMGKRALGLAVTQLGFPAVDEVDNTGNLTGTTFTASDMVIDLGYGGRLSDMLFYGIGIKMISSTIDETAASGTALDLGLLYKSSRQSFCIAVQNLGGSMQYVTTNSPIPMNIKIGTMYPMIPETLLFAVDLNAPSDNEIRLNMGVEYSKAFNESTALAVRFGLKTNIQGLSPMSAVSLGVGMQFNMFNIDFVMVPYDELGSTLRASFGLAFGGEQSSDGKAVKKEKSVKMPKKKVKETKKEEKEKKGKKKKAEEPKKKTQAEQEKLKKQYFTKGQEYFKKKDYKRAIVYFKKILESYPDHKDSKQYIERAEKLLKKK